LFSLYTFDLRNLNYASCVHSDHVRAVLDVDYSPTGKEFVSGSYDRLVVVIVVVNFISGLLNNIHNKENNSKPEKGHSDKTIYVKTCIR